VVTSVSDPPASGHQDGTLRVTDAVRNAGTLSAGASTTSLHLSTDTTLDPGDVALDAGRTVPALAPGQHHSGTTEVTVGLLTPPGVYHVIACADSTAVIAERDETNNCRASSGTIRIDPVLPDLRVAAVGAPPATVARGGEFTAQDRTVNRGLGASTPSRTRYYLSVDAARDDADQLLRGARRVPALAPGGKKNGSQLVTVPEGTPEGTYVLLACADDTELVEETNEVNNCRASTATITVIRPS
jgi:subtilase family serine protease